jgi:hypothetical protein
MTRSEVYSIKHRISRDKNLVHACLLPTEIESLWKRTDVFMDDYYINSALKRKSQGVSTPLNISFEVTNDSELLDVIPEL